ncbi:MAG: hypothetical protein RXN89_00905 [Vulcanisaeta sp.]|jgi:hypothetical protein|nr:MAG: hypothetical protein AT714_04360 [Vulcanisaeta sp. OSP_8]KUO88380.1 MAG: hypothetical protein AT716_01755 [Vulcanisaeta sp. MG_3]KUO94103.1 MAG: hypothetical protein AT717_03780 [Vulcanisaeta sp. CIS_19]MCG2864722.1 hypothetical protein [Vulcanisaeta sp.]MCG2866284.1 hypothetical protein [Vulcanisaeta sp.]
MSSSIPEYLRSSVKVKEVVDGVEVNSFKVPPHRFFVNEELTYLALSLNVDEKVLMNKINELKLGRKTIEKLYAARLDEEAWRYHELELPDLLSNDIDGTQTEGRGNVAYAIYIHVNGIKNFLKIVTFKYVSYVEVDILRLKGYKGIVRYLIHF